MSKYPVWKNRCSTGQRLFTRKGHWEYEICRDRHGLWHALSVDRKLGTFETREDTAASCVAAYQRQKYGPLFDPAG
jgi:hypothetical protein